MQTALGSYGVTLAGEPLPRVTRFDLASAARHRRLPAERVEELAKWHDAVAATRSKRGLAEDRDPRDLAQAGWGIIFAGNDPQAGDIQGALVDLIERRRDQAGSLQSHFFREFLGPDGYQPGESSRAFLKRHRVGPGPANPHHMPYYLLLVGDPQRIPFSFQYQLDVEYAVGRIAFDTLEEYRHYAESVVAAEDAVRSRDRAVFFGPRHKDDKGTELSVQDLVHPLADTVEAKAPGWRFERVVEAKATKSCLKGFLSEGQTPALLFTAGHGLLCPAGHPRQNEVQGALICQEWPGPGTYVQQDAYFSAADVPIGADLQGLITFNFACFSAGTPRIDDFNRAAEAPPNAPEPFLARLPQRLLGQQNGALAAVGHVERAWECSISWPGAGRWIGAFEEAFTQLLTGYPVGAAMEAFGKRYAVLACDLHAQLEEEKYGGTPDPELLAGLWTWCNDARNYAVIGDPAVRLQVPPPSGTR